MKRLRHSPRVLGAHQHRLLAKYAYSRRPALTELILYSLLQQTADHS